MNGVFNLSIKKNKKSRNCGPEILRDLGSTITLPDFIPTSVGAPSNQPQNYRIFPPYPFVNVYKRFIYGYRPFLFPISPHESENQEHPLGRNPFFFHHPPPWNFHLHRLLLSAKRLFHSMAHRSKHRSRNNLFHPHFSLPFPPHFAKLRCPPSFFNLHFSSLEHLPTTVEEI